MTGPGVFVEFVEVLNQFSTQRIQMNVTNEFQKVSVFLAYNGFVPVLEEMACTLPPASA